MSNCACRSFPGKPTSPSFTAWWNSLQVVWRLLNVVRSTFDASMATRRRRTAEPPPGADPSGTPFPEPSGLLLGEGAEVAQVSAILTPKLQDFTTAFNKKCCAGSFLQFTDLHGCICNEQGLTHSITCIQRRMSLGSRMVAWSHILGASAHFCHQCSLPNALKHRKSLAETGMLELTARNLQAPTDCHKQKSL